MAQAFVNLVDSCWSLLCTESHHPKVVIALDEAAVLYIEKHGFNPSMSFAQPLF